MSLSSHLDQLRRKHADLERRLQAERIRPGFDDLSLSALKKEKLRLKDEIARLSESKTIH